MPVIPPALDKLSTLLARLPGVGGRTAMRYAFYILQEDVAYARDLAEALGDLEQHVHYCSECHMLSERERCDTCRDPTRELDTVCVVEAVSDLLAIERTGSYRGLYHVLHGNLSPLRGVGPSQLRLGNLEARLQTLAAREVILATSTDVEGEATALYLAKRLGDLEGLTVSRIATGIPMGGELEYLDQNTLGRAIQGRVSFEPRRS